jgi:hypothetical protein
MTYNIAVLILDSLPPFPVPCAALAHLTEIAMVAVGAMFSATFLFLFLSSFVLWR